MWLLAEEHSHTGGIKGIYQAGFFCKAQQLGVNQQSLSACCSAKCRRKRELRLESLQKAKVLLGSWQPAAPWDCLQSKSDMWKRHLSDTSSVSIPELLCLQRRLTDLNPTGIVLWKGLPQWETLGAEIAGFHPGGDESCTDGRVEGEVIFTSHCLVCTISGLTQLCLWLALTGAQPSLLPLNLSRTMCTHWDLRAGLREEQATINIVEDSLP